MKTVAFHTLGCKVNQYESEAMASSFEKSGYQLVSFDERSDIYVVNTCTVTNLGDRKSRQMIRRAKKLNPHALICVVGCYSQIAPEEVSLIEGVNLILGTKDRNKIVQYVEEFEGNQTQRNLVGDIFATREFENMQVEVYQERTRAFLKIQEGCTQFCSYCIIPFARGGIRSRPPEDVMAEVTTLVKNGYQEIVLAGIHVASYGKDLGNIDLLGLLRMLHPIEGLLRIRLGSIEPTIMTEETVKVIANMPKVCPHFHLSLQSGCDDILKSMNRRYTTDEFYEVVNLIRKNIPDISLTTDIIVGFPGETEEMFEQTLQYAKKIHFSKIHVFPYSKRKKTKAADMPNQVDAQIKEMRSKVLSALTLEQEKEFNESFIGRSMSVIPEQIWSKDESYIEGLTTNYIRVIFKGNGELIGKEVSVKMIEVKDHSVYGEIQ